VSSGNCIQENLISEVFVYEKLVTLLLNVNFFDRSYCCRIPVRLCLCWLTVCHKCSHFVEWNLCFHLTFLWLIWSICLSGSAFWSFCCSLHFTDFNCSCWSIGTWKSHKVIIKLSMHHLFIRIKFYHFSPVLLDCWFSLEVFPLWLDLLWLDLFLTRLRAMMSHFIWLVGHLFCHLLLVLLHNSLEKHHQCNVNLLIVLFGFIYLRCPYQ